MKVRVDLGRVVPGLIFFLAGLLILFLLAIIAAVAFLFSFNPTAEWVLQGVLELTLIPALFIAAGVVTILTGVRWWGKGGTGWLSGVAEARARVDQMTIGQRAGELVGVGISLIIVLFLYANQLRGAAFFKPDFGATAQFYFYAPPIAGMALSFARAVYGRRNPIRPLDCVLAAFTAVAAFWLLSAFPFDFSLFGEMFPPSIQFLFWWVGDWAGRTVLFLVGVASGLNFIYTAVLYAAVRSRLAR
jgi:hypothetical protein